jgi:methyl-accepting chemotaxis protein
MNDFLFMGIFTSLAVLAIFFTSRVIFKRGLLFQMFALIVPSMGAITYIGYLLGRLNSIGALFICTLGVIAVGAIAIVLLNRTLVKKYKIQLDLLMASVSRLSATAKQTAATVAEQASAINQVTVTVGELDKTSQSAASSAQKVLTASSEAVSIGREGIEKVDEASNIMQAIGQVREVVDTVNDLSEQSNLLALNAGIEAAKAGKFGSGFSVVASEVRYLAEQSQKATNLIRGAIGRTDDGQRSIYSVQQVISKLARVLEDSTDDARRISSVASQQSAGLRQINSAMANLSQGGRQTADATRQLQSAVKDLTQLGRNLRLFIVAG